MLPSWKQKELLDYIDQFIKNNGFSPSYREVMRGLDYTSVATVALHINSLIDRGLLRKRDKSARSLEVVKSKSQSAVDTHSLELSIRNVIELFVVKIAQQNDDEQLVRTKQLHDLLEFLEIEILTD